MELAPKRIDVLLGIVHPRKLHHVVPCGRVGTVRPYHEIKIDLYLRGPSVITLTGRLGLGLEPRFAISEIRSGQLVAEE